MDRSELSIRWLDPKYYGINWDATDENPNKQVKSKERSKPICEFKGCHSSVSTKFGRPKPFCSNHVFENPYVQDLLERMEVLDPVADRKAAKQAFDRATVADEEAEAERLREGLS